MTLSADAIGRFHEVWKKEFPDIELTDAEAQEYASRLITLVRAVVEAQPRGRGPPE